MFNWTLRQELLRLKNLNIVTEAPEDTTIETGVSKTDGSRDLGGSTDYDAAAAEMDDADQDGTPDEGTETADNEVDDMEADDYNEEDIEGEDTEGGYTEGDDMEAEDYNEEGETEETTETEPETTPSETGDKTRNRFLIREYINLYNHLTTIIKKLNNKSKTEILSNKVYLQVINNLTDIQLVLYKYIRDDFSDKSYVFNLYQFNLFLEFINVNAEMLAKNNELESKE